MHEKGTREIPRSKRKVFMALAVVVFNVTTTTQHTYKHARHLSINTSTTIFHSCSMREERARKGSVALQSDQSNHTHTQRKKHTREVMRNKGTLNRNSQNGPTKHRQTHEKH